MKPLPNRIYLLQVILVCLASGLALLGLVFFGQEITFWPNLWGYVEHGGAQLPVILGVVPFTHMSFFLSYLVLYLAFEFYGLKTGFYGLMGTIATLTLCYFLFAGLSFLQSRENLDVLPRSILSTLGHDRFEISLTLLAFALGGTVALILAALIRRLMQGYFMFFRYPVASIAGLAFFSLTLAFFKNLSVPNLEERLLHGATPIVQFAIAVLVTLIPLYFIRLIFGIFRGTDTKSEIKNKNGPDNPLAVPPLGVPASKAKPIPEDEITASQKIHRDKLAL